MDHTLEQPSHARRATWWTIVIVAVAVKVYLLGAWLLGSDPDAHAKPAEAAPAHAEAKAPAQKGEAARGAKVPVQDKLDVDEVADAMDPPKAADAAREGHARGKAAHRGASGHGEKPATPPKHEPPGDVPPGVASPLESATPRACLGALAAVDGERKALAVRVKALEAREAAIRTRELEVQKVLARSLELAKSAEARVKAALEEKDATSRRARERLGKLLANMKPKEAALVVARLPVPHAVSTLKTMKAQTAARILAQVPAERAAEIGLASLASRKPPTSSAAPAGEAGRGTAAAALPSSP